MERNGEIWKAVDGFEPGEKYGYEISNWGRVRYVRYLRPTTPQNGSAATGGRRYPHLNLMRDRRSKSHKVHALVAAAFLGPRPDGYTIDHKDFDRNNNRADNLEYVTIDENIRRAIAAGRMTMRHRCHTEATKAKCRRKLTPPQVEEIKRLLATPDVNMGEIGRRFGVSRETIRQIRAGIMWGGH